MFVFQWISSSALVGYYPRRTIRHIGRYVSQPSEKLRFQLCPSNVTGGLE